MIVYHGSIKKFDHFNLDTANQVLSNDIDNLGFWFTSDIDSAKPFAIGTETIIEKSKTDFWDNGDPKVEQTETPVRGYIYKVYIDEPNLREYQSNSEDSFNLFMNERDNYCDYLGSNKTWKDHAILLNKEEANAEFRKKLIKQGYDGFLIHNMMLNGGVTDLYCIFSEGSLHIADVMSVD